MTEQIQHWFLHVDLDAFFASVEQLDNPLYRGKPIIVGGKPEDRRSVVSTASYEARKYGVRSAMPTSTAYKLCPNGIFVYGRMQRYSELSYKIMEILKNYSPDVQQMSIDEAFVDLTGTEKIFGPPEQTAQKIREEIYKNVGLTVSIGLSQSKYFAKIASDVNKPNGFYFVKPGDEQSFILSRPLKDIFGLGTKSQERLKQIGIKTTQDLFDRSLDSLCFLCGENQGTFLYNVVRGKVEDQFSKKAKTHSISTETTFSYDIYDEYTLETCLMNLSYNLRFRLLKENGFSKTIMIKIRYEDFTTVSVQQTYERNILTIDDLFTKAKALFEKKWEKSRGIRLIGLALENIEKEEKPFQQDLFDTSNQKQEKVEKAILNLSKKHPEIKVHKARMLEKIKTDLPKTIKSIFFIFFITQNIIFPNKVYSQEQNLENNTDQEQELEQNKKDSSDLNYIISGFWDFSLIYSPVFSFGNNYPLSVSSNLPIFKQEIDLNIELNFFDNWSFILNFAENFEQNTFTIKYSGNKYLKTFLASNRNVTFPEYQAATIFGYNIGGGQNEAPGIYLNFNDYKNNRFSSDILIRYDSTSQKEITFYGKNKITDITIPVNNFVYGKLFYIPEQKYITNIENIYVENINGIYKDIDGKKYNKLSFNDYIIDYNKNLLILNEQALAYKQNNIIPKVLITFTTNLNLSDFGEYNNSESFLGEIQSLFLQNNIELKNYAPTSSLTKTIENKQALVIQNNSPFSPFLIYNQYDFGLYKESEVFVIDNSSKVKNQNFVVLKDENSNFDLEENFFKEKHLYTKLFNKSQDSFDYSIAKNRFPFYLEDPFIYITNSSNSNLTLLQRTYTAVSNFDIGRNVESSSIKVFVNGNNINNFSYSESSGFVTINQNLSDSDRIYITYNEQSSLNISQNKTITLGTGFKYKFLTNLDFEFLFSSKIPFAPNINFADTNTSFSRFFAFTSGLYYTKENLKISDSFVLAFENPNTTNTLIYTSQNQLKNQTYYHEKNIAFNTKIVPKLNCTNSITLDSEKNHQIKNLSSQNDSEISSYKIPIEWAFLENQNWTSIDIKLNSSTALKNSNKIEFSYKKENSENLSGYRIFIQLGINANQDIFYGEDSNKIPTWEITDLLDLTKQNEWQTFFINLSKEEQSNFVSFSDMRLIIYNESSLINSGRICFGPYEVYPESINIQNNTNFTNNSNYYLDTSSPSYKKYYSSSLDDCFTEELSWSNCNIHDNQIIAKKYLPQFDFNDYEEINFDFAYKVDSSSLFTTTEPNLITFFLQDQNQNVFVQVDLNKNLISQISSNTLTWHTLTINTKTNKVLLDNNELSPSEYTLQLNKNILPTQETLIINTNHSEGYFYNGNIYFTKTSTKLKTQNNINFEYQNKTLQGKISSPFININSTQSFFANNDDYFSNIDSSVLSGLTLFDFNLSNNVSFVLQDNTFNLNDFSISVTRSKPLFNIITINNNFSYNKQSSFSKKDARLILDFNKLNVPLTFTFNTLAQKNILFSSQNLNICFDFSHPIYNNKINTKITSKLEQKNYQNNNQFNHFYSDYYDLTCLQFSNGNINNSNRKISLNIESLLNTQINNFTPKFDYLIFQNTDYENLNNEKTNNTKILFEIPFNIQKQSFNFNYSKSALQTYNKNTFTSYNYSTDFIQMLKIQTELKSFYFSLPIKELFDNVDNKKLSIFNTNSFSYKYELKWKRPLNNSYKDLFIPLALGFAITRDINYLDTYNDIYQLKITKTNNFINLLTKNPNRKIFTNFLQDEYSSYDTFICKLPKKDKNQTILFSGYKNLLLYFNPQNTLRTSFDYKVSDLQNWQIRFTEIWSHTGKFSLIEVLPKLIFKNLKEEDKQIKRKESFSLNLSKTNNINTQTYEALHYCEVIINQTYNMNCSIGTIFTYTQEKALNLSIPLSIGLKFNF